MPAETFASAASARWSAWSASTIRFADEPAHEFMLDRGAVATSGIKTRLWRTDTGFAHHLLNPSTGEPAWTGVIQASSLGGTALEAETLAKMAFLSGPDGCARDPCHQGGLIVLDDGSVELCGPLAELHGAAAEAVVGVNSYTDPGQHIFWIASRAFGVTALILVAVSVGMGLAMAMRSAKGPGAMAQAQAGARGDRADRADPDRRARPRCCSATPTCARGSRASRFRS